MVADAAGGEQQDDGGAVRLPGGVEVEDAPDELLHVAARDPAGHRLEHQQVQGGGQVLLQAGKQLEVRQRRGGAPCGSSTRAASEVNASERPAGTWRWKGTRGGRADPPALMSVWPGWGKELLITCMKAVSLQVNERTRQRKTHIM